MSMSKKDGADTFSSATVNNIKLSSSKFEEDSVSPEEDPDMEYYLIMRCLSGMMWLRRCVMRGSWIDRRKCFSRRHKFVSSNDFQVGGVLTR